MLDKQSGCFCGKDNNRPTVELRVLEHTEFGQWVAPEYEIMIIVKGAISICLQNSVEERQLETGEFIFLPMGAKLRYNTSGGTNLLFLRLVGNLPECHLFRINKPLHNGNSMHDGVYSLMSNKYLSQFVRGLLLTVKTGLKCENYMRLKVSELFYLLHAYYSEEEMVKLFSHISTPDMEFSEFVRMNFLKYKTVEALAAAYRMTRFRFIDHFKRIYRTTPHEWIERRKAQLIYHDICQSTKSLKAIATEYGFSAESNFVRYCNRNFGKSPGKIRDDIDNPDRAPKLTI